METEQKEQNPGAVVVAARSTPAAGLVAMRPLVPYMPSLSQHIYRRLPSFLDVNYSCSIGIGVVGRSTTTTTSVSSRTVLDHQAHMYTAPVK